MEEALQPVLEGAGDRPHKGEEPGSAQLRQAGHPGSEPPVADRGWDAAAAAKGPSNSA